MTRAEWLACDGAEIAFTVYPELVDVMDGTTLPDLPGYLIRATPGSPLSPVGGIFAEGIINDLREDGEKRTRVATVADALTEPQQNALAYGRPLNDGTVAVNLYSGNSTVKALKKRGLCDGFRLSPLGEAVRRELLARPLRTARAPKPVNFPGLKA